MNVEAAPPPMSLKSRVGMIAILGSLTTLAPIAIEMYLPALPSIASDLHSPRGGAELTISAFLIGLALGQLAHGPFSDRVGRRLPILIGLILYCLASAACALCPSTKALIVARFVQGFGGCAGMVVGRAMVRDRFGAKELVSVLSFMSLITGMAPLLAPLAGAAILKWGDWRTIMWVQGACGVILLALSLLFLRETRPRGASPATGKEPLMASYAKVLANRRTLGYALTGGFGNCVVFIYGSNFPAVATHLYQLKPAQISWVFAGSAALMVICAQLNRPLLRYVSSERILSVANSCSLVIGAALTAVAWTGFGGLPLLIAGLTGVMALRGLTMPNSNALALLAEKERVGVASALVGAGGFAWGSAFSALPALFPHTPTSGQAGPMATTILIAVALASLALRIVAAPTNRAQHGH